MRQIRPDEPCPCRSGKAYAECHMTRRIAATPTAIKRRIPLRVLPAPDPETRSVFTMLPGASDSVFFVGNETNDAYVCGKCGTPLILGIPLTSFQNLVLRCSQCGEHNETATAQPVRHKQPANRASRRSSKRSKRRG